MLTALAFPEDEGNEHKIENVKVSYESTFHDLGYFYEYTRETYEETARKIEHLYQYTRQLPLPDYVAINPQDKEKFKSLFPQDIQVLAKWMGNPMLGVPIHIDTEVPRGHVRIKIYGDIHDYWMYYPPKDANG